VPQRSHACFTRKISEYEQWKTRKLAERYVYAFADGTYFTVIYKGEGCKMPILAVVGIAETGERDVLAFSVGDRENEQAWKDETRTI
jgi:putative transposase